MWALAWRNIWRQRTRSLLSCTVVAVAVILTLGFFAIVNALKDGMYEMVADQSGHLLVRTAGWRDENEFRRLLLRDAATPPGVVATALPGATVTPVLEAPALLATERRSRSVQVIGNNHPTGKMAGEYLVAGRLPASDDEIAVGSALAKALRVDLGAVVYALAPGSEGSGAAAYRVVGLLDLPENTSEGRTALLRLTAAQELAAPGAVTRIEVRLPGRPKLSDPTVLDAPRARLQAALGPGLVVETWRSADPGLVAYLELLDPYTAVFAAIFFGLAGLLVVNTIYLSVIERTREFGLLAALGADRWRITRMVLLESLTLVGAGTAAGAALGLALVGWLAGGFRMPFGMAEVYESLGLPVVLHASINPAQAIVTLAFAFLTAVLAALWPAWLAGRLQPVQAMRFAT